MRKLATIRKIDKIKPIEGADRIELAKVGGWNVVVAKDVGHQEGDYIVYCEIDSFLPIREEFEFLRKSSYRKMGDEEGFRLRTIKLRGQISQGLIIPISILKGEIDFGVGVNFYEGIKNMEGQDVSELLGIKKYERPTPPQLSGVMKGDFPSFIHKTDEERIQNLSKEYNQWLKEDHEFYITEKLDGSSATFYYKDGEFGVCSRNLELERDYENTFWKVAKELEIEEKMKSLGLNIAIQGELIGEGIQKNPYNIKGHTVKFFNVFDISKRNRVSYDEFINIIVNKLGFQTVPVTAIPGVELPNTVEELLTLAEGKSELNDKFDREGLVIRSRDNLISFKAISNKFLTNN